MSLQSRPPSEYRPIRRIARACQNCRRKKAKCSGERPICRNCRRLSQVCKYGDGDGTRPKDNQESDQNCLSPSVPDEQQGGIPYDQLAHRIEALEGKIDQLVTTIHSFLPLLRNLESSPSVLPWATSTFEDPSMTYVGQDINQQDQDQAVQNQETAFDKLPPADVTLALINVYFSRVHNQPYSFFHEQDFRQRYADGSIPNYLTFAILASSLRFAKHPYFNHQQQEATMVYASRSWNHIVNVWFAPERDPNLQVCQTVTLLSIIDFTGGRRHPGWMKIGLAIRVAQDLGLMLEPSSELSIIDQEERRKVFWSIYVLDKLCSCGKARPAAIPDAQCDVQLPGREVDSRNSDGQRVQTLKQAFSSVDSHDGRQSHSSFVVLTASIIGKCAQHMIHDQGRGEDGLPPWDSKSDFAKINSTLLQLETQFEIGNSIEDALLAAKCSNGAGYDMQVAGPIIFSYALFYTSHCLINHPFLLYQQSKSTGMKPPASFLSRALESGRENAYLMAKLLKDTEALGCPVFYSYFGYCTTVCASIHTMYINDPNIERQQQARQCLHTERAFLEQYALVWKIGKHMLSIVDKLSLHQSLIPTTCATSPRFELLDSEELVDLWAAVDYTTMSQEPKGAARTSLGKSPNLDTVFNANMNELASLTSVDGQRQEPADQIHDESTAHSDLMPPGTSPFSSIFYDTSMNFGA